MTENKILQAGVVYGQEYQHLIKICKQQGYALAAMNVSNSDTVNAALWAAGQSKTDMIIQVSNGGAAFYAGSGLKADLETKVLGAIAMASHVHVLAKYYGVAVVLHTDHANRSLIPWVEALIDVSIEQVSKGLPPLYSSHMLDLSEEDLHQNVAEVKRLLKKASSIGVSIELEIGITGGEEDGVGQDVDSVDNSKLYTQIEDVLYVYDELKDVGFYTLAAAFGNVHGVYKPGNVQLRPEILMQAQQYVQNQRNTHSLPMFFVFHGGSGSSSDKIQMALDGGVIKMNIDTDTQFSFSKGCYDAMMKHPRAFQVQVDEDGTPYKKYYDPRKWIVEGQKSTVHRLEEAFHDLHCYGKSLVQSS